jgi:hypothetical protein
LSLVLSNTLIKPKLMGKDFLAVAFRLYDLRQTGYIEREEVSNGIFPLVLMFSLRICEMQLVTIIVIFLSLEIQILGASQLSL